jgi:hypothetical protein
MLGDVELLETPYGKTQNHRLDGETSEDDTLPSSSSSGQRRTSTVTKVLERMISYMENEVLVDPRYESVRKICKNMERDCAIWAARGECEMNAPYMQLWCAPVCRYVKNVYNKNIYIYHNGIGRMEIFMTFLNWFLRDILSFL